MLVGERMHQGFFLYTDIWDSISPLSAIVYWFIDWQVGRSQLTYQIIALLLTAIQVVLFNHITNKNQLYPESTHVPGLVYMVLMNLSFDFFTLSPILLAMTFVLMALDKLYIQLDQRVQNDRVFESGFYLAVAALFYLPVGVLILFALLSLLFFGSSDFRQYFLLIFGFTIPFGFAALIFYLLGSYESFVQQFAMSLFTTNHHYFINLKTLLLMVILPSIFTFLGVSSVVGSMRYINYQKRCQQIMVVYLIFVGIYLVITPQLSPRELMVAIPGLAFFIPSYFFSTERKWIGEIGFTILAIFTLFLLSASLVSSLPMHPLVGLEALKVKPPVFKQAIVNRKVLVLGEEMSAYQFNTAATPYLNWQLAKGELKELSDYQGIVNIYYNFEKDLPDVIIDREGVAQALFARMPALAQRYKAGEEKGIYWRRK